MNPSKEEIRTAVCAAGFDACGFARVENTAELDATGFAEWINAGFQGSLAYMERYNEIRQNPELLLPGAKTIIAVAINYLPGITQSERTPQFAYYSYGKDYHYVIRERLSPIVQMLGEDNCRVCVDSAPLRERYWAQKAGIGFVGHNGLLILPNKGSYFFLGFLLTTIPFEPDSPCNDSCIGCNLCVKSCPAKALLPGGRVDCRKCISALTIEYRGEFSHDFNPGNRVYGCDACQKVCPHNRNAVISVIPEFQPSDDFLALTAEKIESMTSGEFRRLFQGSAISRITVKQLRRNLSATNLEE